MVVTIVVDTRSGRQRFQLLERQLSDLRDVLREFGAIKQQQIEALAASGGNGQWPERAEPEREARTEAKAEEIRKRSIASLRKSLLYDVKRAQRRYEKGKGSATAIIRREAALERLNEQIERGRLDFESLAGGDKRFLRRNPRAIGRYRDARQLAERLLGKVPTTNKAESSARELVISWLIPWAGVHNEGGKVGRGAELPERRFAEWTEQDVEILTLLLRAKALIAWG